MADYTWDWIYTKLNPTYSAQGGTHSMLRAFWATNGYPEMPTNDQKVTFYTSAGATGSTLGDLEFDYWKNIAV